MSSASPSRSQSDLADMVEVLLEKGVVINADIAVSVGDTELLGVEIRAAIASFETAAQYGLEFPAGTDLERVDRAAAGGRRLAIDEETEDAGDTNDRPDAEEAVQSSSQPSPLQQENPANDED